MGSHSAMQHQNQHPDVSVFIKNLNEITDGKTLNDIFAEFGTIVSCKLAYDEKGKSKGYAFVQYECEEAARAAIEKLNGVFIDDKSIYVGKFIPRKGRNKERDEKNIYTNLYVKNFGNDFTEEQLRELFEPFGKIKSHKIMTNIEGHSKGFGFVAFEKAEYAEEALQKLNGKELRNGHKLYVARAQKKAERQQELQRQFEEQEERKRRENSHGLNLYVKNLDDSITNEHLRREFSLYGPITSARVMTDSSGRSKGFGFVRFVSPVDACFAAAGLNGRMFGSKPLYVSLAQRKEERRALLVAQHMRQRLQATESLYATSKTRYTARRPMITASHQRLRVPTASPQSSSSAVRISPSMHWSSSSYHCSESPGKRVWRSSSLARQLQLQRMSSVKTLNGLRCLPSLQHQHQKLLTPQQVNSSKSPTPSQLLTIPTQMNVPKMAATSTNLIQVHQVPSAGILSVQAYKSYVRLPPSPLSPPKACLTTGNSPPLSNAETGTNSNISSGSDSGGSSSSCSSTTNTTTVGTDMNEEKHIIGERIYYIVDKIYPQLAGKITGMLLEIDNTDLWYLLNNGDELRDKIEEAYQVYKAYLNELREGSSSLDTD